MKLARTLPVAMFWMALATIFSVVSAAEGSALFKRISTFNICEQFDDDCNTDEETNAETLWYFTQPNGGTGLVYTDSEQGSLGFVDISDPSMPVKGGMTALGGEPTTVRVLGDVGMYHAKDPIVFLFGLV